VGSALSRTAETLGTTGGTISRSIEEVLPAGLVEEAITASNKGALTEAWLLQEFGNERPAPEPNRDARQTIVWWQGRQQEMQKRLDARGGGKGGSPAGTKAVAGKGAGGNGKANGNGNGKAAANGNGKAAANGNGKAAANGNGKAAGNGNGKVKVKVVATPAASVDEDEGQAAAPPSRTSNAASRVKELLNVFGRR